MGTGRDVHLDKPLTNVAIAYRPEGFIADQICPIVPVLKQSDAYFVWNIADAFRIDEDYRAPGTEANVITADMSSDTFFAKNYALKSRTPYEDIKNADAGYIFATRTARAEFIKDKLMLSMERRIAQQVTSGSNVGSYSAIGSAWTDYTNSQPITDLNTAITNVQDVTGYKPNSIIFGQYAWKHFRENTNVITRVYGSSGMGDGARMVSRNNVKSIFEVDRVLVGGAYYSSTDEGQAASLGQIWNDNVLVYYAPLKPRIDKPSFMYSFRWKALGNDMQARVFQLPRADSEEVQLGYYQDEKITADTLAFLVTGVGSSQ